MKWRRSARRTLRHPARRRRTALIRSALMSHQFTGSGTTGCEQARSTGPSGQTRIRVHPPRHDDAVLVIQRGCRTGCGHGPDRVTDPGGHSHRTGIRRSHRPHSQDRRHCRMGLRGGQPQHAPVVEWIAEKCGLGDALGKKGGRHPEVASHSPRIPLRFESSHSIRLPPETQFMAQPN